MFTAIVKLVILFNVILNFFHFTHNSAVLASRDGLHTDTIDKMADHLKYHLIMFYVDDIVCF